MKISLRKQKMRQKTHKGNNNKNRYKKHTKWDTWVAIN